jgi:hypothetical protein
MVLLAGGTPSSLGLHDIRLIRVMAIRNEFPILLLIRIINRFSCLHKGAINLNGCLDNGNFLRQF